MFLADTLSRAFPVNETVNDDPEMLNIVHTISKHLPMSEKRIMQFKRKTELDPEFQIVVKYIQEGWPKSCKNVDNSVKLYYKVKNDLYINEGLLFMNEKLIVLYSLRRDMLQLIHEAHFGIEKCKTRAREIMYWPGMNSDIENEVSQSAICEKFKKASSKKPLKPHTLPFRPFEKIGVDIMDFDNGMVERALGIAKGIMRKAKEDSKYCFVGLMEYRNTPISCLNLFPPQIMFNLRLKTKLPISNKLLNAELFNNIREILIMRQNIQKFYYDETAHALSELKQKESVRIPNFKNKTWEPAEIVSKHKLHPRSYFVKDQFGKILRRNRKHIRKSNTPFNIETDPNDEIINISQSDSVLLNSQAFNRSDCNVQRSHRVRKSPSYLSDYGV
ncbi:hypothetical protein AVEN_157824-1 [Araneus ventricosus]|uniref:RNA-directed DNA polymerase n=1 Tax=Araneus ventricosus TaxID=182803 RepID=A0A4Y2IPG4_ARAVE|nr:hypothetical protein AVEN_157824-1 [Araneus ventricosus]